MQSEFMINSHKQINIQKTDRKFAFQHNYNSLGNINSKNNTKRTTKTAQYLQQIYNNFDKNHYDKGYNFITKFSVKQV